MWDKFFGKKENKGYVSVESYRREINQIDEEIRQINKTIKFYEAKRKALEEWKGFVGLSIKMDSKKEICKNCAFYSSDGGGFCSKFSSYVEDNATCPDFVWYL